MSVVRVRARASRAAGFALVESVLAITIVAIAAAVVMGQLSAVNSHSARVLLSAASASVAEAYLDEIMGRPFEDPGGGTGERRRVDFDDIDDYDRLIDRGARNARGLLIAGFEQTTVRVRVVPSSALPDIPAEDARRIAVTVVDASGGTTLATGFRTRP